MDTHLSQLYGTNHEPSDTELLEIKRLLAPHSARLLQLEKDLEEAEAKVSSLKKEKEDVLRAMKPLKALSSLVRRFPREVMELIFVYSINAGGPTFSICHAPLVLLRVCRSWRGIALTTPQLWKSVELSVPPHLRSESVAGPSNSRMQRRVALFGEQLDRWLERSENCPLSITERGSPFDGGVVSDLASRLALQSSRWESADLDISPWGAGIPLLNIHPDSLPILQHVRIFSFSSQVPTRPICINGFLNAANLKTLHIQVSHSFRRYLKMPINWTNLTRLSFENNHIYPPYQPSQEDVTAPEMLPILKICRNLRILSLFMSPSSTLNPLPAEPGTQVTMPSLEALNITGCRSQIHFLLQSIETARIQEVQYQPSSTTFSPLAPPETPPALQPADPLTSFLRRYGRQMKVLSANLPSLSKADFGSWLECTPALKQLTLGHEIQFGPPHPMIPIDEELEESGFDDSCIEMLTPNQDQPYWCPDLKIFRCAMKSRVSGDTILSFLKARTFGADGRSRIEEVSMHELPYDNPFGERTDEEDERLKPIRDAGVRLSFKKTFYYQVNPVFPIPSPSGIGVPAGFGRGYGTDFKFF